MASVEFSTVVTKMKQQFKELCCNIDNPIVPDGFTTEVVISGNTSSLIGYKWIYERVGITFTSVSEETLNQVIDKVLRDNNANFEKKIVSAQDMYYVFNVMKKFISENVTMYISADRKPPKFIYVMENVSPDSSYAYSINRYIASPFSLSQFSNYTNIVLPLLIASSRRQCLSYITSLR